MPETKSIKEVLGEAIYFEQAAKDLYSFLADKIENPEGAKTFTRLAGDEGVHREKLEGWYKKMFGEDFDFDPSKVKTISVDVETETGAVSALELALQAEKNAAKRYESLAQGNDDPAFVEMCKSLAEQEWGHFDTIESEIQAVTGNFYWFDIDFAGHIEH